ncbi:hypothetical protein Ahy_A04g019809 isoform B [Arachis hypogaea]|uniref:BAG domain-containing protein n=1 Tax=Arachis hypogaea TaxID=3818 RepID=A0A445DGN0_ARAHY|nr:hypothetical protein Ahy_A04g019809 isoform B [Arachis hypogaea]
MEPQLGKYLMTMAMAMAVQPTFEHSSDLQNDEKQRIALGENIMRLMRKLDTIQGLHPNFRETRKSLARELTCLQERLDSVMAKSNGRGSIF